MDKDCQVSLPPPPGLLPEHLVYDAVVGESHNKKATAAMSQKLLKGQTKQ